MEMLFSSDAETKPFCRSDSYLHNACTLYGLFGVYKRTK